METVVYDAYPGETPFISACVDGKLDIAKALYAQGEVDLNARTAADTNVLEELIFKAGNRPLNFTITHLEGRNVSIADPDEIRRLTGSHPDDEFAIYYATALFVLESGADPDELNKNGQSAVFTAAGEGADWLIELLILHGADLNMKDNWGLTPLHFACRSGHTEAVKALLKGGALINPRDDFGFTPAFEATAGKHLSVLQVLASNGADFEIGLTKAYKTNPAGTTPLKYALLHNMKEIAEFLESTGKARSKIKKAIVSTEWKWEENSHGHEGVKITEGKLLWYSHREERLSPSSGATYQEFHDLLEKGPSVSNVPAGILKEIEEWITD